MTHRQIIPSCHHVPSFPEDVHSLPGLLEYHSKRQPNRPLLSIDQDLSRAITLSYEQVWKKSLNLASAIQNLVGQGGTIGIWLDKSIELHLAIFATTIAGCSWLPFDPDVPVERAGLCLKDSRAKLVICDEAHLDRGTKAAAAGGSRAVSFNQLEERQNESDGFVQPEKDSTAYMIYTSGSTGTPKGIEISHISALTFALSERSILGTSEDDIVWQGFSPAFDMFIEEV